MSNVAEKDIGGVTGQVILHEKLFFSNIITVKYVFSGHLPKSQTSFPLINVKRSCIKRSPLLLLKRSQLPFPRSQRVIFYIVFTSIKRSLI